MTCTSCGAEVDDVVAIRRKYVTVRGPDREPSERVVDEIEHWCFACLTHYPHEIIEDRLRAVDEDDVGDESAEQ